MILLDKCTHNNFLLNFLILNIKIYKKYKKLKKKLKNFNFYLFIFKYISDNNFLLFKILL